MLDAAKLPESDNQPAIQCWVSVMGDASIAGTTHTGDAAVMIGRVSPHSIASPRIPKLPWCDRVPKIFHHGLWGNLDDHAVVCVLNAGFYLQS